MTQIKIKYFESSDKRLASQPASQPASLILNKIYAVESPCTDVVCLRTGFSCSFALMFRSFLLKEKNQKFKAYTPEATNSLREAKISENSHCVLRQPRFLNASLGICLTPPPLGRNQLKMEN